MDSLKRQDLIITNIEMNSYKNAFPYGGIIHLQNGATSLKNKFYHECGHFFDYKNNCKSVKFLQDDINISMKDKE